MTTQNMQDSSGVVITSEARNLLLLAVEVLEAPGTRQPATPAM